MESILTCPSCKATISTTDYFCPNCGKSIKSKPLSTSISKQLFVYAISILLPPIGLWWAIKYFKQHEDSSKKIGIAIVVLTVASLAVNIWIADTLFNTYSRMMSSYTDFNF